MRAKREGGFAILAALWAAAFMAIAVASIMRSGRTDIRLADGRGIRARHEATADGIVAIATVRLLGQSHGVAADQVQNAIPTDATPFELTFDADTARVRVQDQAGLIDLNYARPVVLRALLAEAGATTETVAQVTDAILARRPPGDADGGRFRAVAELRAVPGVGTALYDRIAPLLTVHAQTDWIDPVTAPTDVLRVLAEIDDNARAALTARVAQQAGQIPPAAHPTAVPGHAYAIAVDIVRTPDTRVRRNVILRLTGRANVPPLVYAWD